MNPAPFSFGAGLFGEAWAEPGSGSVVRLIDVWYGGFLWMNAKLAQTGAFGAPRLFPSNWHSNDKTGRLNPGRPQGCEEGDGACGALGRR